LNTILPGVTAGIDFGLAFLAQLRGEKARARRSWNDGGTVPPFDTRLELQQRRHAIVETELSCPT
jgi:hypothetical protein